MRSIKQPQRHHHQHSIPRLHSHQTHPPITLIRGRAMKAHYAASNPAVSDPREERLPFLIASCRSSDDESGSSLSGGRTLAVVSKHLFVAHSRTHETVIGK